LKTISAVGFAVSNNKINVLDFGGGANEKRRTVITRAYLQRIWLQMGGHEITQTTDWASSRLELGKIPLWYSEI